MISERSYWIVLIAGLGIFIVVDLLWVLPFFSNPEKVMDFKVDLLINAVFAVFTIVFLSWGLNVREERQWKIVGSKIRERIGYQLFKIFSDISTYFLEPSAQLRDQLSKNTEQRNDSLSRVDGERAVASSLVRYYANQETFELGNFAKAFFRKPDKDVAMYLVENFRRESDFLEHVVSEYPTFLPPDFMHCIMEIEDHLNEIVDTIWVASMLDVSNNQDNQSRLRENIYKIMKETSRLNERGIGFSPSNV